MGPGLGPWALHRGLRSMSPGPLDLLQTPNPPPLPPPLLLGEVSTPNQDPITSHLEIKCVAQDALAATYSVYKCESEKVCPSGFSGQCAEGRRSNTTGIRLQ